MRIFQGSSKSFLSLTVQSTQFCSFLFLLYCICVDEFNIHSFIYSKPWRESSRPLDRRVEKPGGHKCRATSVDLYGGMNKTVVAVAYITSLAGTEGRGSCPGRDRRRSAKQPGQKYVMTKHTKDSLVNESKVAYRSKLSYFACQLV